MKIDHIALQVNDIKESVEYYKNYGSRVLYQDESVTKDVMKYTKLPTEGG